VETIIAETIPEYLEAGITVGLLNSHQGKQWRAAKKIKWDAIICHSDDLVQRVKGSWPKPQLISVTHYGYAAQPSKWHRSYKRVFGDLSLADKIVCLSPAIFETFRNFYPATKLVLAPNGSSFNPILADLKVEDLIYLGKIENRKKQYECWKKLSDSNIKIKFPGPIEDLRVLSEIKATPGLLDIFVGSISRDVLIRELSKYRALLLLSDGEADALVLYEAQLAGLPIIVNHDSLGGQDPSLPWVKVIKDVGQIELALEQIESQNIPRNQISDYARINYCWKIRLKPIIEIISIPAGGMVS
jgi:hypothetical protein